MVKRHGHAYDWEEALTQMKKFLSKYPSIAEDTTSKFLTPGKRGPMFVTLGELTLPEARFVTPQPILVPVPQKAPMWPTPVLPKAFEAVTPVSMLEVPWPTLVSRETPPSA